LPPRGVESEKRKRQYEHLKNLNLNEEYLTKMQNELLLQLPHKTKKEKGETKS